MSVEARQSAPRWTPPRWMNWMMTLFLRAPGLQRWVGSSTALITITGRKSGRSITTPVSYVRFNDQIVTAGHVSRQWWKNLVAEPNLSIGLRGTDHAALAEVKQGASAINEFMAFLEAQPMVARMSEVELDKDGKANRAQAEAALQNTAVVVLKLVD